MLFFFELFLFVLVMLTLALGEFVSRALALGLWLVVTVFALIGYLLARQSVRGLLTGRPEPEAPRPPETPRDAPAEASASLDEKWARTLLYNWRRTNALLLLGALAVTGWWWLGG